MRIFVSPHWNDDPPWLPAMDRLSESLLIDRQQMLHSGGYTVECTLIGTERNT